MKQNGQAADGAAEKRQSSGTGRSSDGEQFDAIAGSVRRLGEELGGMLGDYARLLGTEGRLFAGSLLLITLLGVVLGFLLAGALLLVAVAAIVLLIVHGGFDPVLSVLFGLLVVCTIAAALCSWIRRLSRDLRFTQTRAALAELTARSRQTGPSQ